jgi:hypothetical protein
MPQTVLLSLEADRGFETNIRHRRSRCLLAEWIYVKLIGLEEL